MTRISLAALAVLFAVGCSDKSGDSGDTSESDTDTDTDTDTDADASVAVTWSGSGVTLAITNGDAGGYLFGMVETDPASADPWTGEDCYLGYTLSSGSLLSYCHPASSSGDAYSAGGSATALDENTETVFSSSFESVLTYYLEESGSGACWVWGADTSYYAALSCTEI